MGIKCVFIFCTNLSETFLSLIRTERDVFKNIYRSSCKVSVILVWFNETWILTTDFLKILKLQNFMKIRPVVAELSHADGQRDGQTLRNLQALFAILRKAPTNWKSETDNNRRIIFNLLATDFFFQILAHPVFKSE